MPTNNPAAMNATIEETQTREWHDRYITHEFTASAMKAIWEDYKAETRMTKDPVCLAEWVALVQGTQASTLIDAGIPVEPEKARAQILSARAVCNSAKTKPTGCGSGTWKAELQQIEANFLVLGSVPSSGLPVLRFTNRAKATTIYNLRFPMFMVDKEHNLRFKRGEYVVPQLAPGKSVTVAINEIPGWKTTATAYYKSIGATGGDVHGEPGEISYRIGASSSSSHPFELFSFK
jgi:hypothetical protein